MVDFLFVDNLQPDLKSVFKQKMDKDTAIKVLEEAHAIITGIGDFKAENLEAPLKQIPEKLGLKIGPAFSVLRIAVTGRTVSPPLFESMVALGKTKTLDRFLKMLALVKEYTPEAKQA